MSALNNLSESRSSALPSKITSKSPSKIIKKLTPKVMCFNAAEKKSSKENKNLSDVDFDQAIELTGYGRFHFKLVAVCALCLLNNGMQNGLSSYVFPAAQSDLSLTSPQIGFLNVSFMIGGICSAFLWGAIADLIGRRKVLLFSLAIDSAVTFAASLQQNFSGLIVCRFVNGFLIGASGSITFNYISEFHGESQRSKSVCYSGMFYTAAWLLLPVIAFCIVPLPPLALPFMTLKSWRLFLMIVAVPEFLAAVFLAFLPESPKYAMEKDGEKALKILRRMYRDNKGRDDFPVKSLKGRIVAADDAVCVEGRTQRMLAEMWQQTKKIFKRPLVSSTLVIGLIMFCNMFGYFGLGLWLPELFMRFELYETHFPNATATSVKYLTSMKMSNHTTTTDASFNANLLQNTLAIGMSSLFGNFASGFLSGKVSIKLIPMISLFIGGLASGFIYWTQSSVQNLLMSCIFQAVMAMANITLSSVVVDVFPTSVAGMALCLTLFVGRVSGMLSSLVFGIFMDQHCEVPLFMVSILLIFGAALCFFIPQKKFENLENQDFTISVVNNK